MGIIRASKLPIDKSDPGVDALRIVGPHVGAKHITGGIAKFSPGASILLHTHPCEEMVVVIEGKAICELNGEYFEMQTYDTSFVKEGIPHRFINKTDKRMAIVYFYPSIKVTRDAVNLSESVKKPK